jgi:hypothetical protein
MSFLSNSNQGQVKLSEWCLQASQNLLQCIHLRVDMGYQTFLFIIVAAISR